ncbi:salicylate synthase [Anaeromicropila populeti]|uniref:Yersiniabactin salicyl-AMP ligase n=1 Tax=Anaeromicropila populeti TaxID=37658 RepID=A0A1I6JX26_9FIRM|nr:salicylate synthase [Anaeromicropila populeti]SFR83486.1 yersiniabactin salicyl-AMP ligase [Anaeromicropila populeti]
MSTMDEYGNFAKRYEDAGYWEKTNFGDQLNQWSQKYKERVAIVEGDRTITYEELNEKADEMAYGFVQMGIKKGERVIVQLPNRISFMTVFFALSRVGAIPVFVLPAHREAEITKIIELAKPVAYIIPDEYMGFQYVEMAKTIVDKTETVKYLIVDGNVDGCYKLSDIKGIKTALVAPSHRDIAVLLLSGGTTGIPKLIPRTQTDYWYNVKMAAGASSLNESSVYLAVLPIAHNFAFGNPGVLGTLSVGGKVVMSYSTSPDEVFPLIEKEKVTITALVPSLVSLYLEVLEWDDENDLSSLALLQVGGALLEETIARRIHTEMKCKLQNVFGTAEGLICFTSPEDTEDIVCTCQGKPISDADEIKIVDEMGNDVQQGEYGELLARGPYTIRGYYRAPEVNKSCFTEDGFYYTGDRARITREGNLQMGGRVREQINRAGEKIMPAEVEGFLCTHDEIQEAVVIGIPDKNLGHRSCAFLITRNQDLTIDEVHNYLRNMGVAQYKMPDQLSCIDAWPLTKLGKIDKKKLEESAMDVCYFEEQLEADVDAHFLMVQVCEQSNYDNFVVYENNGELSAGFGIYAMLKSTPEQTILSMEKEEIILENNDLSISVEKAFSCVKIKGWRAYGIANFGLAYYNYHLPLQAEEDCLLKMFIPKSEVRICNGKILLRSLQKEELQTLSNLLKELINGTDDGKQLKQRVAKEKMELPYIFTEKKDYYKDIVTKGVREIQDTKYNKIILSRKLSLQERLDMAASYIAGRRVNTPARSYFIKLEGIEVIGFSPETVAEVDENGYVSTFPLAGTRAMKENREETQKLKEELLRDSKEISEHAVSVKLAYEELERVCEENSVVVTDFMSVLERGTVQHLASRLKGKLRKDCNSWHAFNSLFPAVTASGIPKRESIEAIGRLEEEPRNLYSGSVITYDYNGVLDAALVLRTVFQNKENAWLRAGAGIVEMSTAEREFEETCEKLSSVSKQLVC